MLLLSACASSDSNREDASALAIDGGAGSGDGSVADAALFDAQIHDASSSTIDAMPTAFVLQVSPGSGGSITVSVDSTTLGTCAATMVCTYDIAAGALAMLSSVGGGLQHCSWTGDCAGTFGGSCFLQMNQNHSAGAMYDVSDADCL
jgi:hypothetical protein